MKKQINQVQEFHEKFERPISDKPKVLSEQAYLLRAGLQQEELTEYVEACLKEDIVGIADALGDQLYILCGTMIEHGLQDKMEDIFDEIHKSNMSKLDINGKPIYREDGKVLKGENYFRPDLKTILDE